MSCRKELWLRYHHKVKSLYKGVRTLELMQDAATYSGRNTMLFIVWSPEVMQVGYLAPLVTHIASIFAVPNAGRRERGGRMGGCIQGVSFRSFKSVTV